MKYPLAVMLSAALILSGCFDKNPDEEGGAAADDPALNGKPTISGIPPASIQVDLAYDFTPTASDPDGDALVFSISRKPSWASFDSATGRLSGTPRSGDVGNFTNIGISVSDSRDSAALPDFHITVNQIALGSATLSWMPPTQNVDGSTLIDLAGYRIYYGRSTSAQDQVIAISNPGLTRYVIENLSAAKWYFSMTSMNSRGVESVRSATASKTVS